MSSNPPEQSVPLTFVCPSLTDTTTVTIEFCDRVLSLAAPRFLGPDGTALDVPPPEIGAISFVPRNSDETAGRFRVWVTLAAASASESDGPGAPRLVWDRKVEGGFPVKR
ncbi:hypothetical protein GGX14DRAFT_580202 [Mycena pura]|uniref:Uncharacterized protein n=1 Tax=Mycena pura TaxID=153505 RepID=A0AAD6UQE9_9AGAR|nr:hypothetical protein GGX14DRAFT_580202 [Mycena pura]